MSTDIAGEEKARIDQSEAAVSRRRMLLAGTALAAHPASRPARPCAQAQAHASSPLQRPADGAQHPRHLRRRHRPVERQRLLPSA